MKKILFIILLFISVQFVNSQNLQKDTIDIKMCEIVGIKADNNVPITKTNLSEKQIDLIHNYYEELPLFLNKTPNIISSTDGGHNLGYSYFRLRGIDQTRINITLNGIPLNELEDQGVYFSNYPDFLSSIKSVQIQRGVGTTSNGTASYGGSINFESKDGNIRNTSIDIGGGSFNTRKISIENSTGKYKNFSFYSRFSKFNTDGYKYHSGNDGLSFFLNGGYYGNKNVIKIIAFSGRVKNGLSWYGENYYDIINDPRINSNTEREIDEFNQTLVSLIYNRELNKKLFINVNGFYNTLNGYWLKDYDYLFKYNLNHNYYGLSSNLNYNLNDLDVIFGINTGFFNRKHSSNIVPEKNLLYKNTGYRNNYNVFLKINYNLVDKINIFGDIEYRYTDFDYVGDIDMGKLSWNFINPKIGIKYFYGKSNIYFTVGKNSKEPTRTDLFYGYDNLNVEDDLTYVELPVFLKPANIIDYELGYNYGNKIANFDINLYYMDFKNDIVPIGEMGYNGLPLMLNVDKSIRTGVELSFDWKIYNFKNLNIEFNNNSIYSYNSIDDGGLVYKPLYTPEYIINNLLYVKYKSIYVVFENKVQDGVYIDLSNDNKTDNFTIYNVGFGWNFVRNNSINFKFNNITDELYFTNGYMYYGDKYLFVNPPFNWYITLKMNI